MSTVIRLQRKGTVHRPFWRVVVNDSRNPYSCVEQLGTYDNMHKPVKVNLNIDQAAKWINQGAKPSDTVHQLFKKNGVYDKAKEIKSAGK